MIYFIRAGAEGPVKIGLTENAEQRLEAFQTVHYETLYLIRTCDGSYREEMWFHRQFEKYALRGEWFHYNEAMLTLTPTSDDLSTFKKGLRKARYPGRPGRPRIHDGQTKKERHAEAQRQLRARQKAKNQWKIIE
jgi:hypothetical protein